MSIKTSLVVLFIAIAIGVGYYLIALEDKDYGDIKIVTKAPTMEQHLAKHKNVIGKHSEDEWLAYRGHLYRVLTYSMYFLENGNPTFKKNSDKYKELMEVALVYHDIGLWTADKVNHVYPSVAFMNEQSFDAKYDANDIELIYDIVKYHHKFTAYESGRKLHDDIVNAVRQSNFIDLTGFMTGGLPARIIQKVTQEISDEPKFHDILGRVGGHNHIKIAIEMAKMHTL